MALDGEQGAWKGRAEAIKANDRVQARAIYDKLTGAVATISAWREYLQQQLRALKGRIVEQEARLRSGSPADVAHAQQLLDTLRQREADVQKALEGGQPLERLLARFRSDFEGRRDVSLQERARDMLASAVLVTRRIWNYELFTVADTFETADGRRLDVERSVTIGKTAGAVLIVILGYWLCSVVMRRVEKSLVRRGKLAAQAAALLRSWILFLVGAMLIAFALVSASIPLTAFAFLGGALAIAAGFGLQTLLRNFVAGIMLLFERPMRLGDLVEVDGFRGRVTSIGIRASTITSADGIETMIPNSTFVENKLTNWTYSSPQARQTITDRRQLRHAAAPRRRRAARRAGAPRAGAEGSGAAGLPRRLRRQLGQLRADLLAGHARRHRLAPREERHPAHDRQRVRRRGVRHAVPAARRAPRRQRRRSGSRSSRPPIIGSDTISG